MARRAVMSLLLPRWSSRVFSVERDGAGPCYFSVGRGAPPREDAPPRLFASLPPGCGRCYSLLVCAPDRIRAARYHAELGDKLTGALPAECRVSPMASFLPDARDSVVRGYFWTDPSASPLASERLVKELTPRDPVLACSYSRLADGQVWSQHLWLGTEGESMGTPQEYFVVDCDRPAQHPSTLGIIECDVFHSFEQACEVMRQCGDIIPEARSVMELLPSRVEARSRPDFPVIVIEGLDATGKTTLTESLKDTLGASLLLSPPQCLSPFRSLFDREPPLIRRAFYALGNYITMEKVHQEAMKAPVIIDRFWHSTAAYAIATAVRGPVSNLPAQGSEVYRWPSDLLQPSLVVLLTLDPEERKRRLRGRGLEETVEEQELDHNQLFRLKVEEAYRRISGPACATVDASPSADQVLRQVQLLIRGKRHL